MKLLLMINCKNKILEINNKVFLNKNDKSFYIKFKGSKFEFKKI